MTGNHGLLPALYAGWHTYQEITITALSNLNEDQLALRIEHGLHHGGEISLTLGAHGISGFGL